INIMMRSIIGHQWVRIQWNNEGPKKNTFSLENVHPLNVWCDTTHQLVEDMDYLHFDHVISLDEAIARFPQAQKLLEEAAPNNDNAKWGSGLRRGSLYSTASGRRPMVIIRTSWLRHQEVP